VSGPTTGRQHTGVVKWFNAEKGYGFLGDIDGGGGEWSGRDLFVHYSQIVGTGRRLLEDGQPVEFDIVQGRKGPQAANVVAVGEAPAATPPNPDALTNALKHLKTAQAIIEREARKLVAPPAPEEASG